MSHFRTQVHDHDHVHVPAPSLVIDTQYEDLLKNVLHNGRPKGDRTGTGTLNLFGTSLRYNLLAGFPLLTSKKVFLKGIAVELSWMLRGFTNAQFLEERGVKIWSANADENTAWLNNPYRKGPGDCGSIYGQQWRAWPGAATLSGTEPAIDQFQAALDLLKNDPDSRRILVSAWNVGHLDRMSLSPCHALFQFDSEPMTVREIYSVENKGACWAYPEQTLEACGPEAHTLTVQQHRDLVAFAVSKGLPTRRLSLALYQRSGDLFLGVPFNIASYSLLTHLVAEYTNHQAADFVWFGGSTHIYSNHIEQVSLQLSRANDPRPFPTLTINTKRDSIFDFELEDLTLSNYNPHPAIPAPMAV